MSKLKKLLSKLTLTDILLIVQIPYSLRTGGVKRFTTEGLLQPPAVDIA